MNESNIIPKVYLSVDMVKELLEKNYSATSPENAYGKLKNYLTKNGFKHLKDTNYSSDFHNITSTFMLLKMFSNENSWFLESSSKIHLSLHLSEWDILNALKANESIAETNKYFASFYESVFDIYLESVNKVSSLDDRIRDIDISRLKQTNQKYIVEISKKTGESYSNIIDKTVDYYKDR